ncbi:MAG: undecaprenyl-diphosphate phosphatase, partial [Solirubrobacteraceae bacterium]
MSSTDALSLREAIALGLIQGPAELLPVSSSSHTSLVPWLLRWRCADLGAQERRAFEVALHGSAAVALMLAFWREARRRRAATEADGPLGARATAGGVSGAWPRLRVLAPAVGVPVLAGLLFERPIDRRLSGPASTALGLAAGAGAMVWAERRGAEQGLRSA